MEGFNVWINTVKLLGKFLSVLKKQAQMECSIVSMESQLRMKDFIC